MPIELLKSSPIYTAVKWTFQSPYSHAKLGNPTPWPMRAGSATRSRNLNQPCRFLRRLRAEGCEAPTEMDSHSRLKGLESIESTKLLRVLSSY